MIRTILFTTVLTVFSTIIVFSQTTNQTIKDTIQNVDSNGEIKGRVLDYDTKESLPYTNIYVLHKNRGTISNEKGSFLLNVSGLKKNDTLRFQYIGYKTKEMTIGQSDTLSVIYLKENAILLNESVVFGASPDPVSIVKKVIQHKDENYKKTTCVWKAFIRERNTSDIHHLHFDYKKSSIENLSRDSVAMLERKIPKYSISYTDFLGNIYLSGNKGDSLKIDPIRTVELKEKNMDELNQIGTLFKNIVANTGKNEYWKIKTGIFGQKLDLGVKDSLSKEDTLQYNQTKLLYFNRRIYFDLDYRWLNNKDSWEFLYKTGKYKYTLSGGTHANGEDVYIIDFEPDNGGMYKGRLYIAAKTYALIRADYEYAPGKNGTDFHLLGFGFTENDYHGSIYFEKRNGNYVLKYFSKQVGVDASFNRSLALLKKRKRFLFDKKLKEVKIDVNLDVTSESSVEVLVLDEKKITPQQYEAFKQKKLMDIISVNQFDDKLWKGYSIIEPAKQMRDYKKPE